MLDYLATMEKLAQVGMINEQDIKMLQKHIIPNAKKHLEHIGLTHSLKHLQRMELLTIEDKEDIAAKVQELKSRIRDELEEGYFLHMNNGEAQLIADKEPFGKEATAKFGALDDIVEASKCLGFGRTTACVFHLMRTMELALQKFGDKLGIVLIDSRGKEKQWQNILDEVNKAIKGMDQNLPATKVYAGISALLYNVKLAWRNEVMHPKETYTEQEAHSLFRAVKDFMVELSSVL
jgi:hypothetical protein